MPTTHSAPFGSWKSPVSSRLVFAQANRLEQLQRIGQTLYWLEGRASEAGRRVILCRTPQGEIQDCIPPGFNVRSRVHEYGGGDYLAIQDGIIFANYANQRLYRCIPGETPRPLTPPGPFRYADLTYDPHRRRLVCVCEDHTQPQAVRNSLVAIDLENPALLTLAQGNDFYAAPRLSMDGERLAFLTWRHPDMPWDACELCVADCLTTGLLDRIHKVAGGPGESILQPEWSPDGILYYVSDRSGWWNLYRWQSGRHTALWEKEAEFGLPQWVFGNSQYAFETNRWLICTYREHGRSRLARLDLNDLQAVPIDTPYTEIDYLLAAPGKVYLIAASPSRVTELAEIALDPQPGDNQPPVTVISRTRPADIEPAYLSTPRQINFPTQDGKSAWAYYYPPHNPHYRGQRQSRPPLLVLSHSGPTSATTVRLRYNVQFWTTRGFALLDVDYRGSTGYGRRYRQRLEGQWGVLDVQDCLDGAAHLVQQGLVDPDRMVIVGSSASGFTSLCALVFQPGIFKAGALYYPVSDLQALLRDTHKFEAHILERLIGPYPQEKDLYLARSPMAHIEQLSCPVIIFHGLEDPVIPPAHSERILAALQAQCLPHAYLAFPGEGHGLRNPANQVRAIEAELYFYSRLFAFAPADDLEPVHIENLP